MCSHSDCSIRVFCCIIYSLNVLLECFVCILIECSIRVLDVTLLDHAKISRNTLGSQWYLYHVFVTKQQVDHSLMSSAGTNVHFHI